MTKKSSSSSDQQFLSELLSKTQWKKHPDVPECFFWGGTGWYANFNGGMRPSYIFSSAHNIVKNLSYNFFLMQLLLIALHVQSNV